MQMATKSPGNTPTQLPLWQAPDGQAFPQAPQFSESLFKSTQVPLQGTSGGSQTGRHSKLPAAGAHTGVAAGQTVVQSPQCRGSLYGGTHAFASPAAPPLLAPPLVAPPVLVLPPVGYVTSNSVTRSPWASAEVAPVPADPSRKCPPSPPWPPYPVPPTSSRPPHLPRIQATPLRHAWLQCPQLY